MHHAQTWWNYRHLDNILFVHYADMLADPGCEIAAMAHFLGIELSDSVLHQIIEHTRLPAMRRRGVERDQERQGHPIFLGGSTTFFNQGTNGRWLEILTTEEQGMYDEAKAKVLTPECAAWLEEGKRALA
jgi:aryl sulfotransferase